MTLLKEPALVSSTGELLPSSERMVRIEAGTYTVGLEASDSEHAFPQQVKLAEFWLDQYEVTNAQYAQFLTETNRLVIRNTPGAKLVFLLRLLTNL